MTSNSLPGLGILLICNVMTGIWIFIQIKLFIVNYDILSIIVNHWSNKTNCGFCRNYLSFSGLFRKWFILSWQMSSFPTSTSWSKMTFKSNCGMLPRNGVWASLKLRNTYSLIRGMSFSRPSQPSRLEEGSGLEDTGASGVEDKWAIFQLNSVNKNGVNILNLSRYSKIITYT